MNTIDIFDFTKDTYFQKTCERFPTDYYYKIKLVLKLTDVSSILQSTVE